MRRREHDVEDAAIDDPHPEDGGHERDPDVGHRRRLGIELDVDQPLLAADLVEDLREASGARVLRVQAQPRSVPELEPQPALRAQRVGDGSVQGRVESLDR